MRTSAVILIVSALLGVNQAQAQAHFGATKLKPGDVVRVTLPSGVQLSGVVTAISPMVLTVDGHAIEPEQGLKVERSGDSIWNGFAIGVLTGGVLGATVGRRGCLHGATVSCVAKPGLLFGALGALIDRAHNGRTTVFMGDSSTSFRLTPFLTNGVGGLVVTLQF